MTTEFITVKQAAQMFGVAEITIRTWLSRRKLGYVKLSRAVRIPKSEIDRIIADGSVAPRVIKTNR